MTAPLTRMAIDAAERGWMPDALIRSGIRWLCAGRLREQRARNALSSGTTKDLLVERMSRGPIAEATGEANAQHYEEPTELFVHCLGPRLKYSSGYWPEGVSMLAQAEAAALEETCRHARIEDGMDILDLGCGWGSLSLWMAEKYPRSRITAVSNSTTQRAYIESSAAGRGLGNLTVLTADMNRFRFPGAVDRVVSVEMFEHMHNYQALLERVAGWLRPEGLLFVHVFAHREYAYKYETAGEDDWMARNFFTGGVMPSRDLLARFDRDVRLVDEWWWDGTHYSRTAESWLENMRENRESVMRALERQYGPSEARRWFQKWRMFFMACAELWGYRAGSEWGVAHYLFERADRQAGRRQDGEEERKAS